MGRQGCNSSSVAFSRMLAGKELKMHNQTHKLFLINMQCVTFPIQIKICQCANPGGGQISCLPGPDCDYNVVTAPQGRARHWLTSVPTTCTCQSCCGQAHPEYSRNVQTKSQTLPYFMQLLNQDVWQVWIYSPRMLSLSSSFIMLTLSVAVSLSKFFHWIIVECFDFICWLRPLLDPW